MSNNISEFSKYHVNVNGILKGDLPLFEKLKYYSIHDIKLFNSLIISELLKEINLTKLIDITNLSINEVLNRLLTIDVNNSIMIQWLSDHIYINICDTVLDIVMIDNTFSIIPVTEFPNTLNDLEYIFNNEFLSVANVQAMFGLDKIKYTMLTMITHSIDIPVMLLESIEKDTILGAIDEALTNISSPKYSNVILKNNKYLLQLLIDKTNYIFSFDNHGIIEDIFKSTTPTYEITVNPYDTKLFNKSFTYFDQVIRSLQENDRPNIFNITMNKLIGNIHSVSTRLKTTPVQLLKVLYEWFIDGRHATKINLDISTQHKTVILSIICPDNIDKYNIIFDEIGDITTEISPMTTADEIRIFNITYHASMKRITDLETQDLMVSDNNSLYDNIRLNSLLSKSDINISMIRSLTMSNMLFKIYKCFGGTCSFMRQLSRWVESEDNCLSVDTELNNERESVIVTITDSITKCIIEIDNTNQITIL